MPSRRMRGSGDMLVVSSELSVVSCQLSGGSTVDPDLVQSRRAMRTNFENLRVYRLSEDIADRIWHLVMEWDYFARDTVGKQLVRAADSVGANIAEGDG